MKFTVLEHHPNDSRIKIKEDGICQTLSQRMGTGGGNVPLVLAIHEADGQDVTVQKEVAYALVSGGGKPGQGYPCIMEINEDDNDDIGVWSLDEKMGQTYIHEDMANTLAQRDYKQPQAVIYEIDRNDSRPSDSENK